MSADLADDYGIPRGQIDRAEHMERLEAPGGTPFYVLTGATGERHLVHADVVEYDGALDHPMTAGALGFLSVLGALLGPLIAAYYVASGAAGLAATVGAALGGVVGGWALARVVLYRTPIGDAVFRFLEWNDHKALILASDRGGSA